LRVFREIYLVPNPTLTSLVLVLQEEEYSWFVKHQELMRYSNLKGYVAAINKNKRDYSELSNLAPDFVQFTQTFSPNIKKLRSSASSFPSYSIEQSITYQKNIENDQSIDPKQWLVWKSNSCRLDAFFTIFVFCIMNDSRFDINVLNKDSNKEFKNTINSIMNSKDLASIQKSVDDFAIYREKNEKETVGDYHSIIRLFSLLDELSIFKISITDKTNCACGMTLENFH